MTIAIGPRDWHPQFNYPPVRVYRMSGEALTAGVEDRSIDGTSVRVFNPAKTVADCFKFRNRARLDVALEALRETLRSRKATRGEIMQCAAIERFVKRVRQRDGIHHMAGTFRYAEAEQACPAVTPCGSGRISDSSIISTRGGSESFEAAAA